jgi:DNA repair protein RecN (Recombination protein N)
MLRHLRVTNFAILSDVALDLGEGLNAITGETGAGKSLIVEAVNLLRGGRASADIPRQGADEALVEAIFEIPDDLQRGVASVLEAAGLPDNDGELLVRRVIHRGGRSRTYVNGALTTASRLAELGAMLVDLSGQHQHQGLVDPRRHLQILDTFAGNEALCEEMRRAWDEVRRTEEALAELHGGHGSIEDRIEFLRFQVEELGSAQLREGEDVELEQLRTRLQSIDRLQHGALQAEELIYAGDGAAVDRLAAAAREVARLADIDPDLGETLTQISESRALAEEAARSLRAYADGLDGDPERLSEVEDRLALIQRLRRKHGGNLAEVVARHAALRAELEQLEHRDLHLAQLEKARAAAESQARAIAERLSRSRRGAAERICKAVGEALRELSMASATLSFVLEPRPLGPEGADRAEFLLAANIGEPAKPLSRVASGGELSRIMMALKLTLRRADEVATYVFDEVDTGIGGATAAVVGKQIRAISRHRQVLCVTHLPQIAAFADRHFHVAKIERDGRTETLVAELGPAQRREEMARMLGGARITKNALAHADEMLRTARASRS